MANRATLKKMHWNAWKRIKLLRLYGAIARKMIAGMKVTYASIPATLSAMPPAAAGAAATAAPPPVDSTSTGRPHLAQNVEPSLICPPQLAQKAIDFPHICSETMWNYGTN